MVSEGKHSGRGDAANRLTSVGGVSYTYDHNGCLTNDGTFTYTPTMLPGGSSVGTLGVGRAADLVILDRDPRDARRASDVRVEATLVEGEPVFDARAS